MQRTKDKAPMTYLVSILAAFMIGTAIDVLTLNTYSWAIGGLGSILAAIVAIYCMYRFTQERLSLRSVVYLLRIVNPQLPTIWDKLLVCLTLLVVVILPLTFSSGLSSELTAQLFFYALSAAIIPPLIEELLNRGFIQTSLERLRYAWLLVIVVSSVIFSLSHYPTNPDVIPVTMIAGVVFGVITMRTKSVLIPFILHGIWNFMVTILA